mgnify:CR=1 FL=1
MQAASELSWFSSRYRQCVLSFMSRYLFNKSLLGRKLITWTISYDVRGSLIHSRQGFVCLYENNASKHAFMLTFACIIDKKSMNQFVQCVCNAFMLWIMFPNGRRSCCITTSISVTGTTLWNFLCHLYLSIHAITFAGTISHWNLVIRSCCGNFLRAWGVMCSTQ